MVNNQSETVRNRLLRRVDWRFLLGNPSPQKSICFCRGLLPQAVRSISSMDVPESKIPPGKYDLAVAIDPALKTLQRAFEALQPGGSFYSEWYSPISGGTTGIRHRLKSIGFTDINCYWSWPIPALASPLFWLPIDAPQVIDYFLANRGVHAKLSARMGRKILQILWRFARSINLLLPISTIAFKPDPNSSPTSNHLTDRLFTTQLDRDQATISNEMNTLMWTGGERSINKVILYQFAAGGKAPHSVVKLPRVPEAVSSILHEAEVLQALHARNPMAARSAPQVLFLQQQNDSVALRETTLFGQPLYTFLSSESAPRLAMKVTNWLISLAGNGSAQLQGEWWKQLVEQVLADFKHSFQPVLNASVLSQCRASLDHLGNLPPAFEHRDCSPWNLLITSSGDLAVLDWESAQPLGLPGLDLIYFLTYLAFFMDGSMQTGKYLDSYRRLSDLSTPTGQIYAQCIQHYCGVIGLNPLQFHPLRLLTWMIHARPEVSRIRADALSSPGSPALQESLFYKLVLEELASENISSLEGLR